MGTVFWRDGRVVFVGRTAPPERREAVETDDVERVALAIRRREVRGAPALGAAAAYGLALAAMGSAAACADGVLADVESARALLAAARPGAAGVRRALDRMTEFARRRIASGTEGFAEAMVAESERVAAHASAAGRTKTRPKRS